MNPNPSLISLLQDLIARWSAKSPRLFVAIQWISAIAFVVTGIPQFCVDFGIAMPEWLVPFASKVISFAGIVSFVISRLTVATPNATRFELDKSKSNKNVNAANGNDTEKP